MLDALKRLGRAVNRDYLAIPWWEGVSELKWKGFKVSLWKGKRNITTGQVMAGVAVLSLLTAGLAGVIAPVMWGLQLLGMAGIMTGAVGLLTLGALALCRYDWQKGEKTAPLTTTAGMPCISLSGRGKDVTLVACTQQLIMNMTLPHEGKAELPPGLRRRIAAYVHDSEKAAGAVAAGYRSAPLEEIDYLRPAVNIAGKKDSETVGSVPTALGLKNRARDAFRNAVEKTAEAFHEGIMKPLGVRTLRLKTPGGAA